MVARPSQRSRVDADVTNLRQIGKGLSYNVGVSKRVATLAMLALVPVAVRAQEVAPAPPDDPAAAVVDTAGKPAERSPQPPEPEPEPVRIVVTGTRTPRKATTDPVGTEVYAARELQARNVRDASRVLDAEPGVQTERSFRGSSFQVRGLEAKYMRILQDSMPLVGQVNDVIDLRRYAMEGVERVEVVRGAASALYGSDALAGVVNFISRRPRRAFEASGFAQYGSLNGSAAGLYAGTKRGTVGATLSLNWFGNDSFDLTPGDEDLSTQGDARKVGTGTVRLFWAPRAGVEAMGFVRIGHIDSRGVDLQPPRALWNRRVGETEYAGGSTLQWQVNDATRLTVLAQGNAFARSFWRQQRQGPGLDDQQSLETLLRGEAQLDHAYATGIRLAAGAGGQHAQLDSPRLSGGTADAAVGWGYLQGEFTLGRFGDAVVGGRLDADRTFGLHLSPRLAYRLPLDLIASGLSLRLGLGRGFRAPSLGERYLDFKNAAANYVVHGNAGLTPEVSQSYQASLEWAPPPAASRALVPSLRVSAYRNDLDGLIQPVDQSGQQTYFQYENYATARVQGVEAALRASHRAWTADLGLAALDARGTLDGVERKLPGRAAWQFTAMWLSRSVDWGTEWSVRAQFQTQRTPLDAEQAGYASDLLLIDSKLTQRVWRPEEGTGELNAYLSAENLANATDLGFLALPGRLVQAGLQARY